MGAFERVPRELSRRIVSRSRQSRHGLPIACGQTMPAPADLARRIDALGADPRSRAGDWRRLRLRDGGFVAATKEVVSIERFETLAIERLVGCPRSPSIMRGCFARMGSRRRDQWASSTASSCIYPWKTAMAVLDLLAPGGVMVFGAFSRARLASDGGLA